MRYLCVESMTGMSVSPCFGEVGVLCHVLFFVGGDGPGAEVVDLLVDVVGDLAGVVAALRLENADGFALALDGAALRIDGLDIFVEENDGSGVFGVVGRVGLAGVETPLRNGLGFAEQLAKPRLRQRKGRSGHKRRRATREVMERDLAMSVSFCRGACG